MFYISLPFFYQNFKFNNFFKQYLLNNPDKMIAKFGIEYCYGSFPWSYWAGDINGHKNHAVLYPEMQYIFKMTEVPIRIDWSNCFLNTTDMYDTHENVTLELLKGSNNVCEISDLNLLNYISNLDLNLKFVISNNAQILHPFTEELLNLYSEQDYIDLISVSNISTININNNNKKKIELIIGGCSKCNSDNQLQCKKLEQASIYEFSGKSIITNCKNSSEFIDYYSEIKEYLSQGFSHFKIVTNSTDLNSFNINIIKTFVKPEYVGDCLIEYYKLEK